MRKSLIYIIILLFLPSLCLAISQDENEQTDNQLVPSSIDSLKVDSLVIADSVVAADSITRLLERPIESTHPTPDSLPPRRSRIIRDKVDLETSVEFSSSDSMVIVRRDSAFMYGQSSVSYGQIKLDAAQIEMDLSDNTVYAVGRPDSLGEIEGKPIFNDNGTEYEAATMRYNMSTEKGFITNVVTQQGEGYLTGGSTKKVADGAFYSQNGFYTTCDDHECPHFGFQLTKAKIRPGKDIVTGPAYMVLAGLPLPLA
ncbi:MAG: LPS-assembly protein LptD, partial [Muribaculaceae bacterium]|nr:LPS-assembly protein LptD [Muribaculaceae bacterium]